MNLSHMGVALPVDALRPADDQTWFREVVTGLMVRRLRTSEVVPVPLPVPHDYSGAA